MWAEVWGDRTIAVGHAVELSAAAFTESGRGLLILQAIHMWNQHSHDWLERPFPNGARRSGDKFDNVVFLADPSRSVQR